MPKDFETWIAKYNKLKGWQTIPVPKGEKGTTRSAEKEIGALSEEAKAEEKRLAKELGEIDAVLIDLVRKVRDEHRDLEKFRLENDLKIARKKHKELSAQHGIAVELHVKRARLLEQMQDLDDDIKGQIKELHEDMDEIELSGPATLQSGDFILTDYERRRAEVIEMMDAARDTQFTLRDPNLAETKRYNGISKPEYTLLGTAILKCDALAERAEVDEAMAGLEETANLLDDLQKARKGVILVKQSAERNPEIVGPVSTARSSIAAIRSAGLITAADNLEVNLNTLIRKFEGGKAGLSLGLTLAELIKPSQEFAEQCQTAVAGLLAFKAAVAAMGKSIAELRHFGEDDRALGFELDWTTRHQSVDVAVETKRAQRRQEVIETTLGLAREAALRDVNIDPKALNEQLDKIKQNVETMYKHSSDGERKTQKDAKSQQSKDIKKDSDIPREALDEINMRLKMAGLLMQSNSVGAMERAGSFLADLETFQTEINGNSDSYQVMIDGIKDIRSDFNKLEKRYRPYLLDRRSELKIATDAFDKDYKKQAPDTNEAKLKELKEKADGILVDAKVLKVKRKEYDKKVVALGKGLESLGKQYSKAKYDFLGQSVTGYYGQLTKDLSEANGLADKHDMDNLTDALIKVDLIKVELEKMRVIVEKRLKGGRDGMTDEETADWRIVRADAVKGQKGHDEEVKQKKAFEEDRPKVEKRLEGVKKSFSSLKLDPSDVDVAILELESLVAQQKSQPDYVAAMKELVRLDQISKELEERAKNLEGFKAMPVDTAAKLCIDEIATFRDLVRNFGDKVISVDPDAGTKYDLNGLTGYLNLVDSAIPDAAVKDLEKQTKELATKLTLTSESREIREKALAAVRMIIGQIDSSAAIKHFRQQTFASDTSLDTALDALGRLQVKLLTALKS